MEENETVTTPPIVDDQMESVGVTSEGSTPADTGKRDNQSALGHGHTDNGKKKAKKNFSHQITIPQESKK
jgi:hypothetical protein